MTRPSYDDDEVLLSALRRAVRSGPEVPPHVLEAARAVYTWRTVDAELAALAHDSAVDAELVAVRTDAGPRTLTFAGTSFTVELEVGPGVLLGQLVPSGAGTVEVRLAGGAQDGAPREVPADDLGCFRVEPVPTGPFSLHVRTAEHGEVVTQWLTL